MLVFNFKLWKIKTSPIYNLQKSFEIIWTTEPFIYIIDDVKTIFQSPSGFMRKNKLLFLWNNKK